MIEKEQRMEVDNINVIYYCIFHVFFSACLAYGNCARGTSGSQNRGVL